MPRTGKKKRTDDQRQSLLLLSRKQRLSALKSITAEDVGLGKRMWANVVDLLTQIELRTGRDGCFCYVPTLAAVMNNGTGVHRATLFRTSKAAQEVGLLAVEYRADKRGQQSNEWRVDWHRVSILARSGGWVPEAELSHNETATPPSQTATPPSQTATPPSQTATPYIRNNLSSVLSVEDESTGRLRRDESTGYVMGGAWDKEAVLSDVWRLRKKLGKFRSDGDWSLAVKAVRLSQTRYAAQWLWGAADVAKTKLRPWAYLQTVLADQAEQLGRRLDRDLARVTIPADLAKPDWKSPAAEWACKPPPRTGEPAHA